MADSAPVLDGPNDTGVQVDLDTSGQPTSTPTTNNACTDTCKFKTKRSGKQHDMIQCSVCAQWYHTDCFALKKGDPVGVWPCTSCRHIPEQIMNIVESISTLTAAMNNISNINNNLTKQYETKDAECTSLRNENVELKAQLADLTTKHYAQNPDLVIGDSLLRGINQTKLARTHVTSLPGAKIKDVASNLARTKNKYNSIVICAGTNDCNNDINIDATTEHLEHLLQLATERVACGRNVLVSSIPPRSDDVLRQQRVEELNTILQDVSAKVGVTFISNDKSFRLADGQLMVICAKTDYILTIEEHHDSLTTCGWRSYLLKITNRSTTTKGRRILQNANALLCQVIKDGSHGTTPITTTGATLPTTRSTMAVRTQESFHNPSGREPHPKLGRP